MGWETGISLGANAVSSFANTQNAVSETKATAASAQFVAQNMANQTSRNEGSLETSFLKGGISLGPNSGADALFKQAGTQGSTDIQRTIDNANASISNTMSAARTQSLNGIAQGFSKIGAGTIASTVSNMYQGSWLQSAWNGMAGNLDPSPQGAGTGTLDSSTGIY